MTSQKNDIEVQTSKSMFRQPGGGCPAKAEGKACLPTRPQKLESMFRIKALKI